jgi:hypothetical protein
MRAPQAHSKRYWPKSVRPGLPSHADISRTEKAIAIPDEGVFDPKVIDEITREIKELGDNWKGLSESMATDLATVRRLAEDIKGAVGPEVKAQMDALTASATEKHAAPESKFSARLTTLETKANRHGMGGGFSEAQDKAAASRGRGGHHRCWARRVADPGHHPTRWLRRLAQEGGTTHRRRGRQ